MYAFRLHTRRISTMRGLGQRFGTRSAETWL